MTWQDVNDPTKSATMATPPGNDFNQFLLTGAYKLLAHHQAGGERILCAQYSKRHFPGARDRGERATAVRLAGHVARRARGDESGQRQAHGNAAQGFERFRELQIRRPRQSDPGQSLPIPGCERVQDRRVSVRRAQWLACESWKQHEHLQQPCVQQEAQPVQPASRLCRDERAVASGRLRLAEDRPQLQRRVDRLRRCGDNQGKYAGCRMARERDRRGQRQDRLRLFPAQSVRLQRKCLPGPGSDGQCRPRGRGNDQCLSIPAPYGPDGIRPASPAFRRHRSPATRPSTRPTTTFCRRHFTAVATTSTS